MAHLITTKQVNVDIKQLIKRINELSAKQKLGTLNDSERAEQAALRRIYLDNIKAQVQVQLDNIEVVDCAINH